MMTKCYPVVDPEIESFNLGDDFIGCRQRNPWMNEISEVMDGMLQKMESKTVQISKKAEVSVVGEIIQLINVATGDVVKEIELRLVFISVSLLR